MNAMPLSGSKSHTSAQCTIQRTLLMDLLNHLNPIANGRTSQHHHVVNKEFFEDKAKKCKTQSVQAVNVCPLRLVLPSSDEQHRRKQKIKNKTNNFFFLFLLHTSVSVWFLSLFACVKFFFLDLLSNVIIFVN